MRIHVTEAAIRAAARRASVEGRVIELADPEERHLRLRITPKGVRTWSWMGRDRRGRVRRFTLGAHPKLGLADARVKCRDMAYLVRHGTDPVRVQREQRAAPPPMTLAKLLDLYGQQVGDKVKSWQSQMLPQIQRVFADHLATPLPDLTVTALQQTADDYKAKHSASFGVRCLLTPLRWGLAGGRKYVARDLLDLAAPAARKPRQRVLSHDELARLLPVLQEDTDVFAAAHRLILLTLARRQEIAGARWRDVDLVNATWTLPQTKNGLMHIVPLSRQALALLRARQPAQIDPDALVFTTAKGSPLQGWEAATGRFQRASGTAGWTRHDMRRTAATMLGEAGQSSDVVESALNHASIRSPLAATYNRSRYRDQVRLALQLLADQLDVISGTADRVIVTLQSSQLMQSAA